MASRNGIKLVSIKTDYESKIVYSLCDPLNAPAGSDAESLFSRESEDLNLLSDQSVFESQLLNVVATYPKTRTSRKYIRAPTDNNKSV